MGEDDTLLKQYYSAKQSLKQAEIQLDNIYRMEDQQIQITGFTDNKGSKEMSTAVLMFANKLGVIEREIEIHKADKENEKFELDKKNIEASIKVSQSVIDANNNQEKFSKTNIKIANGTLLVVLFSTLITLGSVWISYLSYNKKEEKINLDAVVLKQEQIRQELNAIKNQLNISATAKDTVKKSK